MALSQHQIEQFKSDGYLVLKSLAPADLCRQILSAAQHDLQHEVEPLEYETEVGYPGAPESIDAPGGRTVRRLRGAYERAECFRQWAGHPILLTMLNQLFEEQICLSLAHHNCVMTKHPTFGTATGWHRDIRYWAFTKPDLISVWLGLGEETANNGGLKFIPGSHRMKIAPHQLDELDFLRPDLPENQPLFAMGTSPELQQGDVVLFHSGLFHAAGVNASSAVKSSLVFAYHGRSNQPLGGSKSAAAGEILLDVPNA